MEGFQEETKEFPDEVHGVVDGECQAAAKSGRVDSGAEFFDVPSW